MSSTNLNMEKEIIAKVISGGNCEPVVTLDRSNVNRDFTHYMGIFLWIGWVTFYSLLFLAMPILFLRASFLLSIPLGMILLSAIVTIDRKCQPQWGFDIGTWVIKKTAEYVHVKCVVEDCDAVAAAHPAIFAFEPHDFLPISICCLNDCLQAVPGHKCIGCASSAVFRVPIMRHISTWINACNADREQIISLLEDGFSPVLCPGGVQEVLHIDSPDKVVTLYLQKRRGFIRIALQFGAAVVPIFAFGLHRCFDYDGVPKNNLLAKFSKAAGYVPVIFYGVWGLPFGPCKPCDLVNVVGRPIALPKLSAEEATEEVVQRYLDVYIEETRRLFETYKERYGMGSHTLRII
jgi:2-acylglycerol O-acyltransferase 2